ncbi:hypothetical protein K449DRAFT_395525 [Hypoxylon sp. EC38]|nr:hypothetical protein K449DRAFT_395525 [Hypoxylon sp. EC38]
MADPLSMSASIAGLISIADLVFKAVYKKTMEKIEKRVKKANGMSNRSKVANIIQQLKWPFTTTETKELLTELSRHKKTLNVALAADSMRKLQLCLTKIDGISEEVSRAHDVVRKIEINTQIEVDRGKQRVLDYFMINNPQGDLRKSINDRHPMTGLWLTESSAFNDWIWLSGIPGAGKTVLAGSVIQEALTRADETNQVGVGFYFCDYRQPMTCEPISILGAIASQLTRQKEEAFSILRNYYGYLHPKRHLPEETPDSEELKAKINIMSELFNQTIIIVDGLDECGDTADDVVKILTELADYGTGVSMAIFSRDHDDVRLHLDVEFKHISIAAHEEDIRIYVGAELEKRIQSYLLRLQDMNMKDEIMEILVERAGGMFRWVVCQLDYLCNCAHDEERREALTKLPPNLSSSYRHLLERANRFSSKVQTMVQLCLHLIAFAEPKLLIIQLRQPVLTPEAPGAYLSARNTISNMKSLADAAVLFANWNKETTLNPHTFPF